MFTERWPSHIFGGRVTLVNRRLPRRRPAAAFLASKQIILQLKRRDGYDTRTGIGPFSFFPLDTGENERHTPTVPAEQIQRAPRDTVSGCCSAASFQLPISSAFIAHSSAHSLWPPILLLYSVDNNKVSSRSISPAARLIRRTLLTHWSFQQKHSPSCPAMSQVVKTLSSII